jgi:hypothetical protein
MKGNLDKVQIILEKAVKFNGSKTNIPGDFTDLIRQQSEAIQVRYEGVILNCRYIQSNICIIKFEIHFSNKNLASYDNWNNLLSIDGMTWKLILIFTSWSMMLTTYYGTLLNIRSFGRQYLFVTTVVAGKMF